MITPSDTVLLLIDYQPQMAFSTHSIPSQTLIDNSTGLAKAAKIFNVPTILTTVEEHFAGPMFPTIKAVFPDQPVLERTSMNAWEDENVVEAVKATGRSKLVIAGLWTEVCLVNAVLSAVDQGYEVYFVVDASGGVTTEAHETAITRMVQGGGIPMTWLQFLLELQRDWARTESYPAVTELAKELSGAYGLGIFYSQFLAKVKM
jgi:nicotinamidase-related amidase